jgi:peptide/nickel transport system ATP-binding protein
MPEEISQKPLLEIRKVSKEFGLNQSFLEVLARKKSRFVVALDSVALGLKKGETLVLLGESGSGKTTLGRLIVGLDTPTAGEIILDGHKVNDSKGATSMRGKLQMVFQDPSASLDPFMNVFDCIAEPLSKVGLGKDEVYKRVRE